ncbi:class F sortase [Candidatus Saccharibacteria bacterium]|nr:class F sortase [Candidatus Saccharibacteria bacterium]
MNSQRVSLSSSVFAGRVKKFDSYQHNPRTSQRATLQRPQKILDSTYGKVNQVNKSIEVLPRHTSPTIINNHEFKHLSHKNSVNTVKLQRNFSASSRTNVGVSPVQQLALNAVSKSSVSYSVVIENQFNSMQLNKKVKKKLSKLQLTFYGVGVMIFLFAGGVSVQTLLTNNAAKEQLGVLGAQTNTIDEQGVEQGTGSDPAEGAVSAQAIANYKTDPELPRVIRIPDLGVYARIKHTGTKNGAVDAPSNINDVSWFNESAKPGNAIGASLLLGHVSGWTVSGVFKKLDQLKPGDRFEIEKGSGEKLIYEVTKGEQIPVDQVDMTKILGTEIAGEHDMKLMTCSGKYNKETKQFEQRYVVYAKILR